MKALLMPINLYILNGIGYYSFQNTYFKSPTVTEKKAPSKNFCKTFFDNKIIKKINLSCIFHYPLVKAALPNASACFDTPTLIYTLMNSTGSKIF